MKTNKQIGREYAVECINRLLDEKNNKSTLLRVRNKDYTQFYCRMSVKGSCCCEGDIIEGDGSFYILGCKFHDGMKKKIKNYISRTGSSVEVFNESYLRMNT
jgi:hypothetical protein